MASKISVQGVVAIGGHFAALCQEVDVYEAFFYISFQREKTNTSTILIILTLKSLEMQLLGTNLLL